MSDVDTEIEQMKTAQAQYLEVQHYLLRKQCRELLTTVGQPPAITMLDEVEIDSYSTVRIGHWGGWWVEIAPMAFNDRLVLTPQSFPGVYDYGWCFDKGAAAYLAALIWNPATDAEPVGFKKRATALRQAGERADGSFCQPWESS